MSLPRAIVRAVQAGPVGDTSEIVTVAVVNGDGTVDVTIPTGTVPKVRCFDHIVTPTVGDEVVMTRNAAGDRWITGRLT